MTPQQKRLAAMEYAKGIAQTTSIPIELTAIADHWLMGFRAGFAYALAITQRALGRPKIQVAAWVPPMEML